MEDRERMFDGDTEESQQDTEESQQGNCVKPEGGWGWVVCCGTFSINFIVFGIHNSFGVVYEYLVDEKNMGEAETGRLNRLKVDQCQTRCAEVLIDKSNTNTNTENCNGDLGSLIDYYHDDDYYNYYYRVLSYLSITIGRQGKVCYEPSGL